MTNDPCCFLSPRGKLITVPSWHDDLASPHGTVGTGFSIGRECDHMPVALWSVSGDKPVRVHQHTEYIEKNLEEWIQREPSLVMEGLRWVARQPVLPDRSRADLIGVTREGVLVVAELKRDFVGIGTLAQALHYVLWLGPMERETLISQLTRERSEERRILDEALDAETPVELLIVLIGTGSLPELDQAAAFLASRGLSVPVNVVTFTPFIDSSGQVLLARHVEEHEQPADNVSPAQKASRATSVDRVRELAREAGVVEPFDDAIAVAQAQGLKVKPWPRSITVVPRHTRGRTLIYLSPRADRQVHFEYSLESLSDLYGATADQLEQALGSNRVVVDVDRARHLVASFGKLMAELQETDGGAPGGEQPGNPGRP